MTNEENIKESIRGFFTAYSELNLEKLRNVCTKDFLVVENAEVLNIEEFVQIVGETNKEDYKIINRLNFTHLEIGNNTALVVYFNEADILSKEYIVYYKWHESAVLLQEAGIWKIKFLHSTLLDKKQERI